MHAIIINTLGQAYAKKDVFFRAFLPDQINWLNSELDSIEDCVDKIVQLSKQQTTRQDYHLAVLISLEQYYKSEFGTARQVWKKILTAYLTKTLLEPLAAADCHPGGVTAVFTYYHNREEVELADDLIYTTLLKLGGTAELPDEVIIPYSRNAGGEGELRLPLEFTGTEEFFSGSASAQRPAKSNINVLFEAQESEPEEEDELFAESRRVSESHANNSEKETLIRTTNETTLRNTIEKFQSLRIPRMASVRVTPNQQELAFPTNEARICNADLQINLAKLIKFIFDLEPGTFPHTDFTDMRAHMVEELKSMLVTADVTIDKLIKDQQNQRYYSLIEPYTDADYAGLKADILTRLRRDVSNVPGVNDALNDIDAVAKHGTEPGRDAPAPVKKLRSYWVLFGKEQKRFRAHYAQLQKEYNKDSVREDQQRIFDVCAESFVDWRTERRTVPKAGEIAPKEQKRPVLRAERRKDLDSARIKLSESTLDALNDFADVRTEAAEIKTRFNEVTRVWSPDHKQSYNMRHFYRFAAIMALIFVIMMILPYVLIDSHVRGLPILKITLYAITFGAFLLLYGIGIIHWMRKRTSETHKLTGELDELIRKSGEDRKKSILRAIETYGTLLPSFMVQKMNLNAMERADSKNEAIERKLDKHRAYLLEARKEIGDLSTALRIDRSMIDRPDPRDVSLDYTKPPYAAVNRKAYLLFDDGGSDNAFN